MKSTTTVCLLKNIDHRDRKRIRRDSLSIFLIGVAVFTIGLCPEFIGFNARFGLFAMEMFRDGPEFFPTIYQKPYPDYPSASIFLIYLVSLPFGRVTAFTAALPTAVVSSLILVFLYRIAAIHDRRWGVGSVIMALLTYNFLSKSRMVSLDQYVSLAGVLCFYLAYSGSILSRTRRLWLMPMLFVMGFVFRGPLGLVVPAGIVCGFYLWERDFKKCLLFGLVGAFALCLCWAGLLAAAARQGGAELVQKVMAGQAFGRMTGQSNGILYYVVNSFSSYAVAYPLAIIVWLALRKRILARDNAKFALLGHAAVWTIVIIVGLSIPAVRKSRYILPVVPPLALAASYQFVDGTLKGFLVKIRQWLVGGCVALPAVACVATVVFFFYEMYFLKMNTMHLIVPLIFLGALVLISARFGRRATPSSPAALGALTIGCATFTIFYVGVIAPFMYYQERTEPFVEEVETLLASQPGQLAFYKMGPDGTDLKFMANVKGSIIPVFLSDASDLMTEQEPMFFIAERNQFERLDERAAREMQILLDGPIGHRECVVFSRRRVPR